MALDKRNLKVLTTAPTGNQDLIKKEVIEKFDKNDQDKSKRQEMDGRRPFRPAKFGAQPQQGSEANTVGRNVKSETIDTAGAEDQPREEKKFTGRCRLFVGNLSSEVTEEEFKDWFKVFGEFNEVFLNPQKSFGFIKMDTRAHAEAARAALDGIVKKGRAIRVRFASLGAAIRLKYLPNYASNELLESAFENFGEVEYAVVVVDDRGKATGEGIIEFARKPSAQMAMKRIQEGVFLLSSSPRPITAEMLDQKDEMDGLPEKFIVKTPEMSKEREQQPRFAQPGTFEYEFGLKWKDLYKKRIESEEALKRQFDDEVSRMEMEMATAQIEHQAAMMRQDLIRRQEELRRLEEQHQMELARRMEMNRRKDEERRRMDDEKRQDLLARDHLRQFDVLGSLAREISGLGQRELHMNVEREMTARDSQQLHERMMRGDRSLPPPMQPPPAPPMGLSAAERNRNASVNMPPPVTTVAGMTSSNQLGHDQLSNLSMRQARFEQNQQITANSGGAMSAIDIGMPPPLDGGMMGQSNGRMGVGHRDLGLGHGQGGMGRPGVRDRQREDFGSYADNKRPRRY